MMGLLIVILILVIVLLVGWIWTVVGDPSQGVRKLNYLISRKRTAHAVVWVKEMAKSGASNRNVPRDEAILQEMLTAATPPVNRHPRPVLKSIFDASGGSAEDVVKEGPVICLFGNWTTPAAGRWGEYRSYLADKKIVRRYVGKHGRVALWEAETQFFRSACETDEFW